MHKQELNTETVQELNKILNQTDIDSLSKMNVNPYSFCALPLEFRFNDTKLAEGTGFLYKHGEIYWLITNWHNVTGLNPNTLSRIDYMAASPNSFICPLLIKKAPPIWENGIFDLYKDEKPGWFVHPEHGHAIDVVAIPLTNNKNGYELRCVNDSDIAHDGIVPNVADEVFILGFPQNLRTVAHLPIWKRGSIASEPDIDLDNLPKLLVDTTGRPGMSGSPVLARSPTYNGYRYDFFAIYSGHINDIRGQETQLGVAWKACVVEEIIKGNVSEQTYFPNESFPG